jgi:polyisoprenyl-phosphate glycosyltransferase
LKLSVKLEIIYVDDGSEDESLKELLKIKKNDKSVKIVKLTRNFGSVHAIKAGLGIAKGDPKQ